MNNHQEVNNISRVNHYKDLGSWGEQTAYRQGLLDAFCLLCDYMEDNFTDLVIDNNYKACDKMTHALRSYNIMINSIETKY